MKKRRSGFFKAVVEYMKENGGVILNTSSMVSIYGQPSGVGYPASKFAVNGITKSLARELAKLKSYNYFVAYIDILGARKFMEQNKNVSQDKNTNYFKGLAMFDSSSHKLFGYNFFTNTESDCNHAGGDFGNQR